MKYHGSPMGLMELRLMEVSPISPTTLWGGTNGTNQAGACCGSTSQSSTLLESYSHALLFGQNRARLYDPRSYLMYRLSAPEIAHKKLAKGAEMKHNRVSRTDRGRG
jgi:hypothetical protein